jgi:hypothetical protein
MTRFLASYRLRRRLTWLLGTAVVVAAAVAIGIHWSNTAPAEHAAPSNTPIKIDYAPPKKVRLKLHDKAAALAVASRFVDTAVARKHVDAAWGLVTPTMRAGYTRKQWDTANLPGIPPYPVASARWQLQFSDVRGVGFTIALFPTKASHQTAQVFMIGLHQVGHGKARRWLVDNWQAAPTTGLSSTGGGGGGGTNNGFGGALASANPLPGAKSRESPIWLLVPVGLLSLIVIIPAVVAGSNWYRSRRAERALLS